MSFALGAGSAVGRRLELDVSRFEHCSKKLRKDIRAGLYSTCRASQKFVRIREVFLLRAVSRRDGSVNSQVMNLLTCEGSSYDGRVGVLHVQSPTLRGLPRTETLGSPRYYAEFLEYTYTQAPILDTTWSLSVSTAD